jgi:hypothetical protein
MTPPVASAAIPQVAAALAFNIGTVRLSHCVIPTPPARDGFSSSARETRTLGP